MLASYPSQHLESQIAQKGNPARFTQTMNRSSPSNCRASCAAPRQWVCGTRCQARP
jgi:hypothetical protein